ncbi:conserved hypothetical protein [Beggiatoa sp. PS]|nr:conserved hypothetical protein [Beggiatoa sp. PS]
MWMKQTISEQRKALTALFEPAMLNLSKICVFVWSDLEGLDHVLNTHFSSVPHCHLIYAVDKLGKQKSSNISTNGIDSNCRDQDLSRRPYCVSLYPKRHFMLSSVYISKTTGHPCISAVQPVINEQQLFLGFVVADFDLHNLPLFVTSPETIPVQPPSHYQIKSSQSPRVPSLLDNYLTEIQVLLNQLIHEHGVFHCLLHYHSATVQLWQIDDPYQYHLYNVEQLRDADKHLVYPRRDYPENAKISFQEVQQVLERFRILRLADDNIYLRSGSLNIMNGMVSLSFSFEGSQYLSAQKFLNQDFSYWFRQDTINNHKYPHFPNEKGLLLKNGPYYDNLFFTANRKKKHSPKTEKI